MATEGASSGVLTVNPTASWKESFRADNEVTAGTKSDLTGKYMGYIIAANIGAVLLVLGVVALVNLRWCTKCMKKKVDLNDIVKKFQGSDAQHLRIGEKGIDNFDKNNLQGRIEEK